MALHAGDDYLLSPVFFNRGNKALLAAAVEGYFLHRRVNGKRLLYFGDRVPQAFRVLLRHHHRDIQHLRKFDKKVYVLCHLLAVLHYPGQPFLDIHDEEEGVVLVQYEI